MSNAWMVEKLSTLMDAKSEEELSDTQIRDKDGVVHDLAELVKSPCVISTGVSHIMSIDDYYAPKGGRWVTYEGHFYNHCEDLAKYIREHLDAQITVYMF